MKYPVFWPGDLAVVCDSQHGDYQPVRTWIYNEGIPLFIIKENTLVLIVSSDLNNRMVFVVCNGCPVEVLAECLKVLE